MPSQINPSRFSDGQPVSKAELRAALGSAEAELEHGGFYKIAAAGAIERKVADKLAETLSLADFGARLDGTTDDTAAWQKAINYINTTYGSAAGQTTIKINGRTKLAGAKLKWGNRQGIRMEVDGQLVLSSPLRITKGNSLIGIGGSNADMQFGPRPICVVNTTGFSGPAIWTAGNDLNTTIENVCVYLHAGGPGIQVGYSAGDSNKTQTCLVRLKNVSVQCTDDATSEGLRLENVFWLWVDDFAFAGKDTSGDSINIADSWSPPGVENCSCLVYIRNGVINHKGVKFGRSAYPGSGYTYGFLFENICYENCTTPWFTFDITGGGYHAMLRLINLDVADTISDARFIYVAPTNIAKIDDIRIDTLTWPYGPILAGDVQKIRGINIQQAHGNFPPYNAINDAVDPWPRDSIFNFEGEHYGPVAWRGSGYSPHMLPANCINAAVSQVSGEWGTDNGNTPTYMAGRVAPDGSATAVRVVTSAGAGQSLIRLGESGQAVGDWFIAGSWIRNNSATIPVAFGLELFLPGGTWFLCGVEENMRPRKVLHMASGKSGWVFCYSYDKVATLGANNCRLALRTMDGTDLDLWNPFLIRIPAALGYSTLDAARLASHMVQVSPTAKPGVVHQLDHQTFRTGLGATGSRPSASAVGAGAQWFDTVLKKPIWSDGSGWRDAAGNLV